MPGYRNKPNWTRVIKVENKKGKGQKMIRSVKLIILFMVCAGNITLACAADIQPGEIKDVAELTGIASVAINNDGTVTLVDREKQGNGYGLNMRDNLEQGKIVKEIVLKNGERVGLDDSRHVSIVYELIQIKDGKAIFKITDTSNALSFGGGIKSKIETVFIKPYSDQAKKGKQADFNGNYFWIYKDKNERVLHHYTPRGWMGDYGDIRFSDRYIVGSSSTTTCIQIKYSAKSSQKADWAGIYWLYSPGSSYRDNGYDLRKASKLVFIARGEKGGEIIREFKVGGVKGEYPDTCEVTIGPVTLTKDWQEYVIDLKGKDLSYIDGGFAWTAEKKDNPDGMIFYLDEIRYEK